MTISVRFFASLGEQLGRRQVDVNAEDAISVLEVWNKATNFHQPPDNLLCALNQSYAAAADSVKDGDEVAFFPPVNGG